MDGEKKWSCSEANGKEELKEEMEIGKEECEEGSSLQNASSSSLQFHPRRTSSKYDFVKVRVWLGDNADHYYVLSRFLMSRMLTVTKIPNHVAVKISLELKKLLIDNSLLDVSQTDLEANLFKLMERRGYGEEYINQYRMMTRFHHQRVPLVILVCGTACVGKSTIATQLAQCLNLPNVLQTDMVYELLRSSTDAPLTSTPIWEREFSSSEELVSEFCRECRIVRKGLDGDLRKAMKDGKPIIIEGIHLDPSIYLMDEENAGTPSASNGTAAAPSSEHVSTERSLTNSGSTTSGVASTFTSNGNPESCNMLACLGSSFMENQSTMSSPSREKGQADAEIHQKTDHESSDTHVIQDNVNTTRSTAKAIIVPIILKMDEFDHKTLLEEWITCRSSNTALTTEAKQNLFYNLMTIQDYLCSFRSPVFLRSNLHWPFVVVTQKLLNYKLDSKLLLLLLSSCQFWADAEEVGKKAKEKVEEAEET